MLDNGCMSALPNPPVPPTNSLSYTHAADDESADARSVLVHPGTRAPINEAHYEQLRLMSYRARPIERAAGYAKFSGWTTLLAGACSLPFALGSVPMVIFCVALAGIGTRELTLRRRLLLLDCAAPRKLALNQLVLGLALSVYAVYMLFMAPASSMMQSAIESDPMLQSTPELAGMLDDMANLEKIAKSLMYAGIIVIALFVQGSTAIYYSCKARVLKRLHKQSPDWCVRVYQTMKTA